MKDLIDTDQLRGNTLTGILRNKATVSTVALVTALAAAQPAWATIDNTVTATGSSPGNTDDITATADEEVDVDDAEPSFTITKTADLTSNVAAGTTVTYTYVFTNTGNVTIENVSLSDAHEGDGGAVTPTLGGSPLTDNGTIGDSSDDAADNTFDTVGPNDVVTWTATYDVTATDVANQVDNDLDNTVTVTATPAAGTFDPDPLVQPFTATEEVDLEDVPSLVVTKVATLLNGSALPDPNTADAAVGDIITYTYTVENDGNVPITNVSLNDVTNGSGTAPSPADETVTTDANALGDTDIGVVDDGVVVSIGVGDIVTFTGTYTVTQDDVDNLQ